MRTQLILQPNGLLGLWRKEAAHFMDMNLTREEALRKTIQDADPTEAVESALRDEDALRHPGTGHDRWDEAISIIERVHGAREAERIRITYAAEPDRPPT
jgi:hypothetical protein